MSEAPFITIVMPVRNEARFIAATIDQLLAQQYPPDRYEIMVVDGMSDDGTREIVRELALQYSQVRLVDNPQRRSSAGRNVGFRGGRGDYFLVIDGHCYIPDNQLLQNVVDCFEKSGADCLGRPQPLDPPGLTAFQQAVSLARGSRLGHGGDSLIFGDFEGFASPVSNGAAYRRQLFDTVGYVDETFDAAEDVEFNYRVEQAGLTCYTSPKLAVRYYPRENLSGLFRQMIRYGKGRWKFTRKHREALTVNQMVPAAFVAGLGFLFCSLWVYLFAGYPLQLMIMSVPYLLYVLLLCANSFKIMLKHGVTTAVPIAVIIFTVHFGLGCGFLNEALCGSSRSAAERAAK